MVKVVRRWEEVPRGAGELLPAQVGRVAMFPVERSLRKGNSRNRGRSGREEKSCGSWGEEARRSGGGRRRKNGAHLMIGSALALLPAAQRHSGLTPSPIPLWIPSFRSTGLLDILRR